MGTGVGKLQMVVKFETIFYLFKGTALLWIFCVTNKEVLGLGVNRY